MPVRGQGSNEFSKAMCCKQARCSLPLSRNLRFKASTEFEAKLFAKQNLRNAVSRGRAPKPMRSRYARCDARKEVRPWRSPESWLNLPANTV